MNKIYIIIAGLRQKFVTMTYGLTKDKNEVDEVVQECMLYFMQMNPETLNMAQLLLGVVYIAKIVLIITNTKNIILN